MADEHDVTEKQIDISRFERRDSPRVDITAEILRDDGGLPVTATGKLSISGFYFELDDGEDLRDVSVSTIISVDDQTLTLSGKLSSPKEGAYLLRLGDLDFDLERVLARYIDSNSKADQDPLE